MRFHFLVLMLFGCVSAHAATRGDSLRGGNGPGRRNWDVRSYQLKISIDTLNKSLFGSNVIDFQCNGPIDSLQIDLQGEMRVIEANLNGHDINFRREENVTWVYPLTRLTTGSHTL